MNQPTQFTAREKLFDFLDDYAAQRREEIDQKDLGAKTGLIKSYVLETSAHSSNGNTLASFKNLGWQLSPLGDDEEFHYLRIGGVDFGYLETFSPRYFFVHTFQETEKADNTIRKVTSLPDFDFLWLAGDYLSTLWQTLILPHMPERLVSFRFEHEARFENPNAPFGDATSTEEPSENEDSRKLDAEEITERPVSASTITEQARRLGRFLPDLQAAHPPFKAIKMLRMPATATRGGYDFWSWGKITYRAPSFREGRGQTRTITQVYQQATQHIERMLWLYTDKISNGDEHGGVVHGAPLILEFERELDSATFKSLIDVTFERGDGPLRLWGNPIWLGEDKAHVYGVDLHLWQRLYMELTPQRIVALLPKGTCGNTVHRLMTNIQRYVDPSVKLWIGDILYSDLIRDVLTGKLKE